MDAFLLGVVVVVSFALGALVSFVGYRLYLTDQTLKVLQTDYQRLLAEREVWRQRSAQ